MIDLTRRKQSLEHCTEINREFTDQEKNSASAEKNPPNQLKDDHLKMTGTEIESDETKLNPFGHRDVAYVWRWKGETLNLKILHPYSKMR